MAQKQQQNTGKHLRSILGNIPDSARKEILKYQDIADVPIPRKSDYIFLKSELKFDKFKDLMYQRQTEHRRKLVKASMVYADRQIE